jgi:hypothetical protein
MAVRRSRKSVPALHTAMARTRTRAMSGMTVRTVIASRRCAVRSARVRGSGRCRARSCWARYRSPSGSWWRGGSRSGCYRWRCRRCSFADSFVSVASLGAIIVTRRRRATRCCRGRRRRYVWRRWRGPFAGGFICVAGLCAVIMTRRRGGRRGGSGCSSRCGCRYFCSILADRLIGVPRLGAIIIPGMSGHREEQGCSKQCR